MRKQAAAHERFVRLLDVLGIPMPCLECIVIFFCLPMVCRIYPLLVGIDNYPAPLSPLRGCINDIDAFEQYLTSCVQNNPDYELQPAHRLVNNQATRQAVIEGFQMYLNQAQAGDVALFYYSGHGSQAPSPPEFWQLEPDHFNETLVCWDSRQEGQWDLADKELASLIAQVDRTHPHILIILDCCHSGAGTRDLGEAMATRQVPADLRPRPFESFVLPDVARPATRSAAPATLSALPQGRHVLLAACRENEKAREFVEDNHYRGAFSYFLVETLAQAGAGLSYRDVFKRTQARVRSQVATQSPQLEATHPTDLDRPFLGASILRSLPYYTVSYDSVHGWVIDGGAVHGVPQPVNGDFPKVTLFPFTTSAEALRTTKSAIAQADIIEVLPQLSRLRITAEEALLADTQAVFKAAVVALPLPAMTFTVQGDEEGVQQLQTAFQTASPDGQPSPYVREVSPETAPLLQVTAQANAYWIRQSTDNTLLVNPIQGYDTQSAVIAVRQLEQIARWFTVADLTNPASSQIPSDALQIQIEHNDQTATSQPSQIQLSYQWDANRQRWQQPTFRVQLINQSDLTLYCALYDLTEDFKITSLLEGGTVRLGPQEKVWVAQGQPIYASVPKARWQEGITECRDVLKAIACTTDFDALLLEQGGFDGAEAQRSLAFRPQSHPSTLNHLMQRVMVRALDLVPEDDTVYDDWITHQVIFSVVRPQSSVAISAEQATDLGYGITLSAHPQLRGAVRLSALAQATRDLNAPALPPLLQADPQVVQLFQLVPTRNLELGLNVLELKQVTQAATVTSTQPLILQVPIPLQEDEYVLPVAFDGEFFIPLGYGHGTAQGTEIRLERLPAPTGEGTRSLGGSIRILFQKVVAQKLGLKFPYPTLAAVEELPEGAMRYEAERSAIVARVKPAHRILLVIHGMFGDSQTLLQDLQSATAEVLGQSQSLLDHYDLVLTFDYENINTPLGDLAQQLSNRLTAIGLGSQHDKTLHLLAYGIGGLLARCFIEQKHGYQRVQHLVMLGTPNAGSPWATLQDWVTSALAIGINSLSAVAFPVRALGSLMAALELVDVTLDQIKPGSDFLRSLADSADPGVPYTVLAGNAALIPLPDVATRDRVVRLLGRLGRAAVEFPFMSQPNDLAATVYSMRALPDTWSQPPHCIEVPCDHLNYLTNTISREVLSTALLTAVEAIPASTPSSSASPDSKTLNLTTERTLPFWLIGLSGLLLVGMIAGIWFVQQRSNEPDASFQLQSAGPKQTLPVPVKIG